MADERELIAERERKVAELRAAGRDPYANGFAPSHTVGEIVARFPPPPPPAADPAAGKSEKGDRGAEPDLLSEDRFRLAGRIVAHRGFGKAAFVKLRATMKARARASADDYRGRQLVDGNMDVYQWFLMISTHSQRHILQIREVKAHAQYPKR